MNNARRRREIMVLSVLLSSCTDILKNENFKNTYSVFKYIEVIDRAITQAVPVYADKIKEINKAQMLVNPILPITWMSAPDEWKLWFTAQVAYRLVAGGWKFPNDTLSADFVQALYYMAQNLHLANPPSSAWMDKVILGVQFLLRQGLYK